MLSIHYSYLAELKDILDISQKRYDNGDIDLLDKTLWDNRYYELENKTSQLESEEAIIENKLKILILSDRDFIPAESQISLYPIDRNEEDYNDFFNNLDGFPEDSIIKNKDAYILFKEKENALLQLVSIQNQIGHYETHLVPLAQTYEKTGKTKLELGDIDYSEYFLYLTKVFEIQTDYINLINKYNQAALELEQKIIEQHAK